MFVLRYARGESSRENVGWAKKQPGKEIVPAAVRASAPEDVDVRKK